MALGRYKAWARRWVQNPIASGLLLIGLCISLWSLPKEWRDGSVVGAWIGSQPRITPYGLYVYAVRDGSKFRIIDENSDSADESSRLMTQRPADMFLVSFTPSTRGHGFYALTTETTQVKVRIQSLGSGGDNQSVAPADHDGARRAFVEWLRNTEPQYAADLARGDSVTTRPLWAGYVHNGAALVGLLLLVYSLAWVLRAPEWLVATRRQRALARGRCPSCGYSIGGLPDTVCPECGKPWDTTAEDPPVSGLPLPARNEGSTK